MEGTQDILTQLETTWGNLKQHERNLKQLEWNLRQIKMRSRQPKRNSRYLDRKLRSFETTISNSSQLETATENSRNVKTT